MFRLALCLAALILALPGAGRAAPLSDRADLLARLGVGDTLAEGVVQGMDSELAALGWPGDRRAAAMAEARAVVDRHLPRLLEDLAPVMLAGLSDAAIQAEHRRAQAGELETGFPKLRRWDRYVQGLWTRDTTGAVARLAGRHGLAFAPALPPPPPPAFAPVENPSVPAARRYWRACRARSHQVEAVLQDHLAGLRRMNPTAPAAVMEPATADLRAMLEVVMGEMEPALLRQLSTQLTARELDHVAEWCGRPAGRAFVAVSPAQVGPVLQRWMNGVLPEMRQRLEER